MPFLWPSQQCQLALKATQSIDFIHGQSPTCLILSCTTDSVTEVMPHPYGTQQQNNNRFTALCPELPWWAGTRRNIHPPTILIIVQSLSASSMDTFPCQFRLGHPSSLQKPLICHSISALAAEIFFLHSCPRHLNFHSILPVQITCLAIFLYNLSPRPLWSTSWSGALHLIFHTCLHPISVFFSQHMPIQPLWNKAPNYLALLINFFLQQSHLWRQVTVQLLTSKPGVGQITDWTSVTCHRQPAVTCLWLLKEKPLGSTGCKACRWLPKRDNLSQTTIRRLTGCWWQVAHRPWMQKVWIHIHWFKDSLHRVSQLAMSITACNFTSLLLRYTTF